MNAQKASTSRAKLELACPVIQIAKLASGLGIHNVPDAKKDPTTFKENAPSKDALKDILLTCTFLNVLLAPKDAQAA